MSREIKAVIFDIDDTLFDRNKAQAIVFEEFKRKYADLFEQIDEHMLTTAFYEADRLSTEYFYAGGGKEYLREKRFVFFLDMLELDGSYAREMSDYYVRYYIDIDAPVDEAAMVVDGLKDKYKLGAISNGLSDTQIHKLKKLNIHDYFESIIISDEHEFKKPEAEIFWESAKELGFKAEDCLYVGNSYNGDVIGADNAGMITCWLNPSRTHPVQMPVKPDYEIAKLAELLDIL